MPAPPEFLIAFSTELAKALTPAINAAWDAGQRAVRTGVILGRNAEPPKKEPTSPRLKRGAAPDAILAALRAYQGKGGATRDQIRRLVPGYMNGQPMSEHTLKRALMAMRKDGKIVTVNSRWRLVE
jgi:hypothetical protein